MDVDAIVKLLLAASVAISLLVIAIQIARVLSSVVDLMRDVRRVTNNVGDASDMIMEDYKTVRGLIADLGSVFGGLSAVLAPLTRILNFINRAGNKGESATGSVEPEAAEVSPSRVV